MLSQMTCRMTTIPQDDRIHGHPGYRYGISCHLSSAWLTCNYQSSFELTHSPTHSCTHSLTQSSRLVGDPSTPHFSPTHLHLKHQRLVLPDPQALVLLCSPFPPSAAAAADAAFATLSAFSAAATTVPHAAPSPESHLSSSGYA